MIDVFFLPHLLTLDVSFQSRRYLDPGVEDPKTESSGNKFQWPPGKKEGKTFTKTAALRYVSSDEGTSFYEPVCNASLGDLPELSDDHILGHLSRIFDNTSLLAYIHEHWIKEDREVLIIEGVGYIRKTWPYPPGPRYLLCPPRLQTFNITAGFTLDYDVLQKVVAFGCSDMRVIRLSQNYLAKDHGSIHCNGAT